MPLYRLDTYLATASRGGVFHPYLAPRKEDVAGMRRRALVLVALMAGALAVTCGVAWAATVSCPNRDGNLCVGTNNKDTMTGRDGRPDEMNGQGGPDEMKGRGAPT